MTTLLTAPLELAITRPTFPEIWSHLCRLVPQLRADGKKVYANRRWADFFSPPRGQEAKLLGWNRTTIRECERLAPGGTWSLWANSYHDGYQFNLRYSKFLPYAYAMMMAEHGFSAFGFDFESINSEYGTCLGFESIATKCEPADAALYQSLTEASFQLSPPQFPFDEAFKPAICFVFVRRPKLLLKPGWGADHGLTKHAAAVVAHLGPERMNELLNPPPTT